MTNIEIVSGFELEINKIDDAVNKPSTDDSLFWLNQAIAKFVKLRFNGDFVHGTGYEETEKRRKDLVSLFRSKTWNIENEGDIEKDDSHPSYDQYTIEYKDEDDILYTLNEDVIIDSNEGGYRMDTCVFECTRDSFMYRVNNSLTDFHYKYHKARPLRIRTNTGCVLLTDKNYTIESYTLGYLKKPTELKLDDPRDEYEDFDDHIMYEIIKMAAQMYIENQSDPRYRTIVNEVNTQE